MNPTRSLAHFVTAILTVVGLTLLGSIPFAIADDLRERSQERPQNVANGTVISVETGDDERQVATVEYVNKSNEKVRFQAVADLRRRAQRTLAEGDRVLVAYDTANPERARIWSIRRQWTGIVTRAIGGVGCLCAALAVSLGRYLRSRRLTSEKLPS